MRCPEGKGKERLEDIVGRKSYIQYGCGYLLKMYLPILFNYKLMET